MSRDANIALTTRYYEALAEGDFEALADLHSEDVERRLGAINTLIGRYIERRMKVLRLSE